MKTVVQYYSKVKVNSSYEIYSPINLNSWTMPKWILSDMLKRAVITFALRGEGVHQNVNVYKQREGGSYQCEHSDKFFLIDYLVHELLTVITRF